jgi:DNA polymerase-1
MGKTWATLTYDDIAPYAAKDAELTLRLYEWQQAQAEYQRVLPAVEPYLRFEALMHRMECAGVAIDRSYVDQLVAECEDEIEGIRAQFPGVSLDSTPQLRTLIYETWGLTPLGFTGKGAPSTSREALELLEGAHPDLDKILRYRKAKKLVSGFLSQLLKEVGADGRVHPSFNASSRGGDPAASPSPTRSPAASPAPARTCSSGPGICPPACSSHRPATSCGPTT